ncbi:MAG: response regulator [Candidatus Taylorbacteria bacterium]|nr:response regulator [Candidatus Taylorbacteria bacterium]
MPPTNKNKKVLIVDDDRFLSNMYSVKFKKFGFDVDTGSSGQEVLIKLKDGLVPDVILLDVVMPSMDGIELLENIRKEKLVPNAFVIMLSNQNQQADVDRARNLGISSYIVKASSIPSEVVSEVMKVMGMVGR